MFQTVAIFCIIYLPQAAMRQRAVESRNVALARNVSAVRVTPEIMPIKDYLVALETLQNVPTAELELLTG